MQKRLAVLVLLVLFIALSFVMACRKKHDSDNTGGKIYTQKMAGSRQFAGTDTFGFSPIVGKYDTQTYNIEVLNDSTLKILSDTIHYVSHNEASKSLFFKGVAHPDSVAVTYFYEQDSITYFIYSRVSLCCFNKKVMHTIDR